jgi:hypothetical protein
MAADRKKKTAKRRPRFQVVIDLGMRDGPEARMAIEKAASRAQLEVSAWCRRVLLAAAGMADREFATRADLLEWDRQQSQRQSDLARRVLELEQAGSPSRRDMEVLIVRLEAVEEKAGIDPFPLLDPSERSRRSRMGSTTNG